MFELVRPTCEETSYALDASERMVQAFSADYANATVRDRYVLVSPKLSWAVQVFVLDALHNDTASCGTAWLEAPTLWDMMSSSVITLVTRGLVLETIPHEVAHLMVGRYLPRDVYSAGATHRDPVYSEEMIAFAAESFYAPLFHLTSAIRKEMFTGPHRLV